MYTLTYLFYDVCSRHYFIFIENRKVSSIPISLYKGSDFSLNLLLQKKKQVELFQIWVVFKHCFDIGSTKRDVPTANTFSTMSISKSLKLELYKTNLNVVINEQIHEH